MNYTEASPVNIPNVHGWTNVNFLSCAPFSLGLGMLGRLDVEQIAVGGMHARPGVKFVGRNTAVLETTFEEAYLFLAEAVRKGHVPRDAAMLKEFQDAIPDASLLKNLKDMFSDAAIDEVTYHMSGQAGKIDMKIIYFPGAERFHLERFVWDTRRWPPTVIVSQKPLPADYVQNNINMNPWAPGGMYGPKP